jgi:hypothetical protein
MKDKKELLKELNEAFEKTKTELGFKSDFEKIDNEFFIKDAILDAGYVSDRFERQLCSRMVSTFYSWTGETHAWLIPPQGNIICHTEYKVLEDTDKKLIKKLTKKAMYFLRQDKINAFKKDKTSMGRLVDEMVLYKEEFKKDILLILEKQRDNWLNELKKDD